MRILFITVIVFVQMSLISAQTEGRGPGCYAKCFIPDRYETYSIDVPVYLGGGTDTMQHVQLKKIETKKKGTKWIKKKADGNCLSSDPEDCVVYCLVKVPAEFEEWLVVTDTLLVEGDEWDYQEIKITEFVSKGGTTEWKEVICDKDMTPSLIRDVQEAIISQGYSLGDSGANGVLGEATKSALVQYQKANGLPTGQFNLETMDALGVDY